LNEAEAFLRIIKFYRARNHQGRPFAEVSAVLLETEQSGGLEDSSSMFGGSERAPGNQRRRDGHKVRPNVDNPI
jgi:hypothetical protein